MEYNRKEAFTSQSTNPCSRWLEWKSEQQMFSYYDKANGVNVPVALPFRFLVLNEYSTVKGWHDSSNSGITANEVKFIGKEPLTVRSFKGGLIAKGIYKEIKEMVNNAGGHYSRSIYIMLPDGTLANLQLKGSATQAWGDFTQKTRSRLTDEWVEVASATEAKKGRVTYSTPDFNFGGSLDVQAGIFADKAFNILMTYMDEYMSREDKPEATPPTPSTQRNVSPNAAFPASPARSAATKQAADSPEDFAERLKQFEPDDLPF